MVASNPGRQGRGEGQEARKYEVEEGKGQLEVIPSDLEPAAVPEVLRDIFETPATLLPFIESSRGCSAENAWRIGSG